MECEGALGEGGYEGRTGRAATPNQPPTPDDHLRAVHLGCYRRTDAHVEGSTDAANVGTRHHDLGTVDSSVSRGGRVSGPSSQSTVVGPSSTTLGGDTTIGVPSKSVLPRWLSGSRSELGVLDPILAAGVRSLTLGLAPAPFPEEERQAFALAGVAEVGIQSGWTGVGAGSAVGDDPSDAVQVDTGEGVRGVVRKTGIEPRRGCDGGRRRGATRRFPDRDTHPHTVRMRRRPTVAPAAALPRRASAEPVARSRPVHEPGL